MMAGISSRNTKPEILLRRSIHAEGFRFRLHRRDLPGTPDFVLPRFRAAVFVHGCFWHHHVGCKNAKTPATRSSFWAEKFDQNRRRDDLQIALLREGGWRVAVVWECAIRKDLSDAARRLAAWLRQDNPDFGACTIEAKSMVHS